MPRIILSHIPQISLENPETRKYEQRPRDHVPGNVNTNVTTVQPILVQSFVFKMARGSSKHKVKKITQLRERMSVHD